MGRSASGNDPPPTDDEPGSVVAPSIRWAIAAAWRAKVSCRAVSMAKVGIWVRADTRSWYNRNVASSAAITVLPGLMARVNGLIAASCMTSRGPTMIPACGPPSNLSPENTAVAPVLTTSLTNGSSVSPYSVRSSNNPLPTS